MPGTLSSGLRLIDDSAPPTSAHAERRAERSIRALRIVGDSIRELSRSTLVFSIGALVTLGMSGVAAQSASGHAGVGQSSSSCPADNARFNKLTPYKTSLDFVPVTTDDSLGFHVAYSGKTSSSGGSGVAFNVGIFLFPLDDGGLLVFGGGYGDPRGAGTAANDAAFDVSNIEDFVRQCLGRNPGNTPIDFVSPHWHGDHINVEIVRELANAGFNVRNIWFHEDDDASIRSYYSWTSSETAKFRTFPNKGCNVEIGSFQSTLGKVWFVGRSGHAAGAIDLVLDVRDNTNDRVLILGSEAGGNCPTPPSGVRWIHKAHGNAQVSLNPEVVPYGCGLSAPGSLSVLAGEPKLGTDITIGIDDPRGDLQSGSTLSLLYTSLSADPSVPCGSRIQLTTMARPYEILINTQDGSGFTEPLVGGVWLGPGQPSPVNVNIPFEPGIVGSSAFLQGAILEIGNGALVTGIVLTEGLELRLGR